MLTLSTDGTPLTRAAQSLRVIRARLDAGAPAAAGADILVHQLRQAAPARSGRLRQSIVARPSGAVVGFWGLFYGKLLARGTRPHTIQPRNSNYLLFRSGGRLVFARRVHHPGTRPDDFPRRAAAAAQPALRALLVAQARHLARTLMEQQ